MITGNDLYTVLTAMVPLYVAMMLGFASVRWWSIFSDVQCSGINRFVAVFAVPLLSFSFISSNNPYKMDLKFILADSASKVVVFVLLACWAKFSRYGSLDWLITLFSLATLPNTLVMGIPLLRAMYGGYYGDLMVQVVVLQSIIWYTLLLFLFEFRAARMLLMEQFPETAASIVSFKVDADVVSLDGREPLHTQAQVGEDGKIRVFIRRSISASQRYDLFASPRRSSAMNMDLFASPRRSNMMNYDLFASPRPSNMNHNHTLDLFSMGLTSVPSSKAITPRPSNLTGAEIYSLTTQSSQTTPRDITLGFTSTFNEPHNHQALYLRPNLPPINAAPSPRQSNFTSCEMYSLHSSRCHTPRASSFQPSHDPSSAPDTSIHDSKSQPKTGVVSLPPEQNHHLHQNGTSAGAIVRPTGHKDKDLYLNNSSSNSKLLPPDHHHHHHHHHLEEGAAGKEVHSFIWSSSTSPPVSESVTVQAPDQNHSASFRQVQEEANSMANVQNHKDSKAMQYEIPPSATPPPINVGEDFSFGSRTHLVGSPTAAKHSNHEAGISVPSKFHPTPQSRSKGAGNYILRGTNAINRPIKEMPSSNVMVKLILQMVGRKLIRNPNTYASLIGVVWSLVAFRFGITMPKIISESLRILSQAGLGMAMFSLGLFMALQPRLIACGTSLAVFAMAVRFLTGPAVMAASSIAVGLRGIHLHAAIVQAALPQGIVPFVFSREYDLHPDILSTAVIFGMLVALPTTLLYYFLLGI